MNVSEINVDFISNDEAVISVDGKKVYLKDCSVKEKRMNTLRNILAVSISVAALFGVSLYLSYIYLMT